MLDNNFKELGNFDRKYLDKFKQKLSISRRQGFLFVFSNAFLKPCIIFSPIYSNENSTVSNFYDVVSNEEVNH